MKKCPYCGAEHPDDVLVCPIDQTPIGQTPSGHKHTKLPESIDPSGRWLIFGGIPTAVLAVLVVSTLHHGLNQIPQIVGENAAPYIVFFTPAVIVFGSMFLYDHFPKRLVLPCGIIGWVVAMSLFYWYFWFGPGAYGHH